MTPERYNKRILRSLRTIPVEAIEPELARLESQWRGVHCLVADEVRFIGRDGLVYVMMNDDDVNEAQCVRWLLNRPERVHETLESARAFVRKTYEAKSE
jgi:hypothetical protein